MKEIPLTRGKVALVDDADYEWLNQWKWCAHKNHRKGSCKWYALRRGSEDETIYMHRQIMAVSGNKKVDHKDRDGLNNQRHNLRLATNYQNLWNQGLRSVNNSGFRGVGWFKKSSKWRARITVRGKEHHLGLFHTKLEAVQAYSQSALQHFGEFCNPETTHA